MRMLALSKQASKQASKQERRQWLNSLLPKRGGIMLRVFKNKGEAGAIPLNAENLNFNFTEVINMIRPVGSYYETSDKEFNPNNFWPGTWILDNDGTVLVSKSNVSSSKFNVNVGTIVGTETHKLTTQELPNYQLKGLQWSNGYPITLDGGTTGNGYKFNYNYNEYNPGQTEGIQMPSGGQDKPHNNIQPSKIVYRWHRTA